MNNVKTSTAQTEKYIELHASSLNCMQAHGTACKLMELHQAQGTLCKLIQLYASP